MREIKFRDWNPETKEMRYFDLDWYDREEHNAWWNIMQFTGMKDKNGIDIYEWDIIWCWMRYDDWDFKYWITEVKWEWYWFNIPWYAHDFYLLWNIYEQETFKKAVIN